MEQLFAEGPILQDNDLWLEKSEDALNVSHVFMNRFYRVLSADLKSRLISEPGTTQLAINAR